jgi:hypothetical protein
MISPRLDIRSRAVQSMQTQHPFGAHGILLALPLSIVLWAVIIAPFM